MIMTPDWIGPQLFSESKVLVREAKKPKSLDLLRMESLHEGLCVQIMHIGPYADEGPTLKDMHENFIPDHGYAERGKHHEIYLGDPRKTAPEKLRTVLRQPIRKL